MENYINSIIDDLADKINAEKERLIFQRCCEKIQTNEPIDFAKEGLRRFPRMKIDHNSANQTESYYWNDGSDEGLHLITFYFGIEDMQLNAENNIFTGFKYI